MTGASRTRPVRLTRPIALLGAAALTGVVVAVSLRGGASAPAAPSPPALGTATIVRTDLTTTTLTGGTLGYAPAGPLINQLSGIYTEIPKTGTTITRGQPLYRVDDVPAVLMTGTIPAWRPFALGMPDGPDVRELQANLIALGDAAGLLFRPSGHFDWLTADAVERWQLAEHQTVTGEIPLGEVVFLPSAVRVGAQNNAVGQPAAPAQVPYQATSTRRTVSVPLNPNLPPTTVGERVSILLPSGSQLPGRITAIGPPPPAGSTGSGGSQVSNQLAVIPLPAADTGTETDVAVQVSLTTSSVGHALAAPVAALLALEGGGYGLEVVEPSGTHRLVGVRTGVFAGSLVQVSGAGLAPGTKVVVAQ
jgi:peptidoglycan hydrolase-like protein with peptidoglycan-binding domain